MNEARAMEEDPRRQRSRASLLAAFFELVVSRPYGEIAVADVITRAGVARSTFYEHFRGKDELLAASLAGPFGILADALSHSDRIPALARLLEHFWSNRVLALTILRGAVGRRATQALVVLVEQRLRGCQPLRVPLRLAAVQLAGLLLAGIGAWLEGGWQAVDADDLARALSDASIAARRALQRCP